MDWSTIVTIVLGSSLLGTLFNSIVGYWTKRKESNNHATFIALNIAHIFEKYAENCLSVSMDHENYKSSNGHIGDYIKKIPKLAKLPEYDYKVFDLPLLDEVFDFLQRIEFAQNNFSFAFEVLDGEEAVEEGNKSCLLLAQKALSIADKIRKKYKLQKRELKFGEFYSVRDEISTKLKNIK